MIDTKHSVIGSLSARAFNRVKWSLSAVSALSAFMLVLVLEG